MQRYLKPEQYKNLTYKKPYPSDEINPDLKREKEFFLCFSEAVMADYASNNFHVPFEFGSKRSFEEQRRYATGQQSSDKIKQTLIGKSKKNKDGKYLTKMNVSFDTYYKLPQMFDVMREKNMSQEYDVAIHCIDDDSLAAKEADKAFLKYMLSDNDRQFRERAGFKPNTELDPAVMGLQNDTDVDRYFETGGFTLHRERACIAACQKTKMVSEYKVNQDATFDDLIQIAFSGWKAYIDGATRIPTLRKVDPDRAILRYSKKNNFSDLTLAGEIIPMSIADIHKENPKFTSADLMYLAKEFVWMNPEYNSIVGGKGWYDSMTRTQGYNANYDIDPINRCKVLVLDIQWLSTDIESHLKNVTGSGHVRFKSVAFDYVPDEKSKKKGDKKIQKKVIRKYYAKWIVGTDMFLDYGVCKDVIYYGQDGNKTPRLDYFFVKTGNASLVERCIAIVDDIDMMIVKHRNTLATLPAAPAMAIQKDLLENVMLNGILQQPEDVMQALIERGVLYYNGLDDHGKPLYFAGGQKPIDFMDVTKVAGLLSIISNEIALKVNELKEVTGLQNGADAGNASPYQGLGQTKLAFQASNASLYPTFNAYNYLFKEAFDHIIKMWQIVAKDGKMKVGYSPLGNKNMKVLELSSDFTNAEFNSEVDIAASNEEKQALLQDIVQQKDLGITSNGTAGLTTSEFMYVWDRVMGGNTREAMYVLAQIEQKKEMARIAEVKANQQANIQDQQESARLKAQFDKEQIDMKGQQVIDNTLVSQLLKQNQELMKILLTPKGMGEGSLDTSHINGLIAANNEAVGAIVSPTEQQVPPEQMQAQAAPMGAM